mmetsp:Transcript_73430/g.190713  ORF Transcript_73430/g.190713 Transcript_73430/m.190713 type:complete len:238 (-) Transcript_73430:283-996(-)
MHIIMVSLGVSEKCGNTHRDVRRGAEPNRRAEMPCVNFESRPKAPRAALDGPRRADSAAFAAAAPAAARAEAELGRAEPEGEGGGGGCGGRPHFEHKGGTETVSVCTETQLVATVAIFCNCCCCCCCDCCVCCWSCCCCFCCKRSCGSNSPVFDRKLRERPWSRLPELFETTSVLWPESLNKLLECVKLVVNAPPTSDASSAPCLCCCPVFPFVAARQTRSAPPIMSLPHGSRQGPA